MKHDALFAEGHWEPCCAWSTKHSWNFRVILNDFSGCGLSPLCSTKLSSSATLTTCLPRTANWELWSGTWRRTIHQMDLRSFVAQTNIAHSPAFPSPPVALSRVWAAWCQDLPRSGDVKNLEDNIAKIDTKFELLNEHMAVGEAENFSEKPKS